MSKRTKDDDKKFDECRNESSQEVLLRDKNVRAFHNIVLTGLMWLVVQNAMNDYFYDGGSQYGFKRFFELLSSTPAAILSYIPMMMIHLPCFLHWKLRIKLKGVNTFFNLGWNHFFALYAFLQILIMNVFGYVLIKYNISTICRFSILITQILLTMKRYAYLRTNMQYLQERGDKYVPPTFSHYLYFTFAPTLVYKDSYQRSTLGRSWWKIFCYAFELFATYYFLALLDSMYMAKSLSDFGKEPFGMVDVVYAWIQLACPAALFSILAFNSEINTKNKLAAELMCFGERQFSSDWWISTNSTTFYMKTSSYIQNFIYVYVYKEINNRNTGSRWPTRIIVFAISTIVHELIIFYCTEIVFPMFIIVMFYSITQAYYPKTGGSYNLLASFQLYAAIGLIVCILRMEYFAKLNCPNRPESLIYYPRLLSCEINNH